MSDELYAEVLASALVLTVPAGTTADELRRADTAVDAVIPGARLYLPAPVERGTP